MIQDLIRGPQITDIPIFPVHNLWSVYNNLIIITEIKDFIYLKNLHTKHQSILYLYDINLNDEPYGYEFKKEAIRSVDRVICRCDDHASKISQLFRDCNPLKANLEQIIDELGN